MVCKCCVVLYQLKRAIVLHSKHICPTDFFYYTLITDNCNSHICGAGSFFCSLCSTVLRPLHDNLGFYLEYDFILNDFCLVLWAEIGTLEKRRQFITKRFLLFVSIHVRLKVHWIKWEDKNPTFPHGIKKTFFVKLYCYNVIYRSVFSHLPVHH